MWCRLHVHFEKFSRCIFPLKVPRTYWFLSGEIESFLSSAKEHWTFGLHGELWILFLYFCLKDTDIVLQVERFAPLVTVWWNPPFWEEFALLWTKKVDGGTSKGSCWEHVDLSYTLDMLTDCLPIHENSHISFHSHSPPLFSSHGPSRHFAGRSTRKKRIASCEAMWKVKWTRSTVALWSLCRSPSITTGLFCWCRKCCSAAFE